MPEGRHETQIRCAHFLEELGIGPALADAIDAPVLDMRLTHELDKMVVGERLGGG